MERRELEDRLRASLQARADDVQPTPELWERVAERTTRRARWQLGAWVLSGVAAVAVLVLGGVVLFNQQDGVRIDPQPDVMDTPTDAPVPPGASPTPTVVTTDGQALVEVDPTTGEVVRELQALAGFSEGNAIREVAVRPVQDGGALTVAMVLEREGTYDLEVMAFDADGARTDRVMFGPIGQATDLPPRPAWSDDGRFVLWSGTNGPGTERTLWAHDWWRRPIADEAAGLGEAVAITDDAEALTALFADDATVDLHAWDGDSDGESVVTATTPVGSAFQVTLTRQQVSTPTWTAAVSGIAFEGRSPVALGTLDSGVTLALVAVPGQAGDAEGATLELLAEPMSDAQRQVPIPELTSGTASPADGWLAVAGDRVAVGFGPSGGHLLTVTGDVVEDLEVVETVPLPDGTWAADVAQLTAPPAPPTQGDATPTDDGPTEVDGVQVADDGAPRHVVTVTEGGNGLALADRTAPDDPLATWAAPDGVDGDMTPVDVVVHPDSTATDLEVVTRWSIGEADVLARTVVRDGTVELNQVLRDELQPANVGGAAETADPAPVFAPSGDWLAWVETPEGASGPSQLRLVGWGADGATGDEATVTAPGDLRPARLLDWAGDGPGAAVLTLAPMSTPGTDAQQPTTMIELRLQVMDGALEQPSADDWTVVDLPGVVFAAGSYPFGDGAERYIAFQRDDEVVVSVAEAPETAVPTGAFAFSEGRVVAFGPGSAVVQRPDGGWQRVQVDDGAATELASPAGTAAFLPWSKG